MYRLGHHLPFGPAALLLVQSWLPALVLFPLVIVLFPDGRPPPGRWRWALTAYVAVGIGFTALLTANASVAIANGNTGVDAAGQLRIFDHGGGYRRHRNRAGLRRLVCRYLPGRGRVSGGLLAAVVG